jgi:NhaP-type Na+/H+ or K+/H+ antiporter
MKTFLYRSIIGILIGSFISIIVTSCIIYFGHLHVINGENFLKNSFGSIFCGWFFTVSKFYFELESLSLPQRTALHFVTVIVLYFSLFLGIGWIPFDLKSILISAAIFIVIYIVMWVCNYLYFKNLAKQMNEGLKKI